MKNLVNKLSSVSPQSRISAYKFKNKTISVLLSFFRFLILISVGYIVIYPLFYMIVTSLRDRFSYADPSVVWIPERFAFENYIDILKDMNYLKGLKNTILIEVVSAGIEIFSCSVVAYGLARFEFKSKKILMAILILTIVVPSQMIIIPMMMNFAHLDLFGILGTLSKLLGTELRPSILDTPLTFYLPSIFGIGLRSGIMIFIYIQFFKGLPKELEEAAWIDGAGPVKTFLRIAIPSSGVVFLTNSIFSIVWHWNDYYLAAMYMTEDLPLAVSLANLPSLLHTLGYGPETWNAIGGSVLMAACFAFILPMLIMYIILQRKFVKSIDRVGITG